VESLRGQSTALDVYGGWTGSDESIGALNAARAVAGLLGSDDVSVRAFIRRAQGRPEMIERGRAPVGGFLQRCDEMIGDRGSRAVVAEKSDSYIEALLPLDDSGRVGLHIAAPRKVLEGRIEALNAFARAAAEDPSLRRNPAQDRLGDAWQSPASMTEAQSIRVLVVDAQRLSGELLAAILAGQSMAIIGVATTAADALHKSRSDAPTLVIVDLEHPDGAIELGKKLLEDHPNVRLLALSSGDDHRLVNEAVSTGFHGCVARDVSLPRFLGALWSALNGQVVISDRLAGARSPDARRAQALADSLTRREREVLGLLVSGTTSDEIARTLSISANTVRTHIASILTKLQVHSRLEAVTFATRYRIAPRSRNG